jgi:single-strand DNA-binding protein
MNEVRITGNLAQDPQTRNVGQTSFTNFTVASTTKWRSKQGEMQEKTAFIDCKLWGEDGQALAKYCKRGSRVTVIGSLDQENWERDGQKRSKLVVKVKQALREIQAPRQQPSNNGQHRPAPQQQAEFTDEILF